MSKMPSNIYSSSFQNSLYRENSLEEDFDDDLFNHHLIERRGGRGPHKNSFKSLEKKKASTKSAPPPPPTTTTKTTTKTTTIAKNQEYHKTSKFSPDINLCEGRNSYYIHADLQGVTKDHITIELDEYRILTISGKRKNIIHSDEIENSDSMSASSTVSSSFSENGVNSSNRKALGPPENVGSDATASVSENRDGKEDDEMNNESKNEQEKKKGKGQVNEQKRKRTTEKENYTSYKTKEGLSVEESSINTSETVHSTEMKGSCCCRCCRKGYRYDKFKRSLSIPEDADLDTVHAKLENGVLDIIFSKMDILNIQDHIL